MTERAGAASAEARQLKAQLEAAEQRIADLTAKPETGRASSIARPRAPGPASPEAPWHGPKVSPGPGQRGSESYRDPSATSRLLRQMTARRKVRGRVILVAGLAVPFVALLIWGTVTKIQFAAKEPNPPSAETADTMAGPGSADGGQPLANPETAALSLEPATGKLDLGSAVPPADGQDPLQKELRAAQQQIADLSKAAEAAKAEVVRLREELAARQQEAAATQPPTGPGATAPSDQNPAADQKDPDQTQDAEDVEAAPEIEEILTAAEISSDPVTSETAALRDTVSPDDLLLEPGHHVGREVVVTGSVVWLLRRYWLQSGGGHMRMLIDVKGLQLDDRNKLKDAVVQIEFLAQARARITGTIERQGSENYRLVATELVLVE